MSESSLPKLYPIIGTGNPTPRDLRYGKFCVGCGGDHDPDPPDAYVDFEEHHFTAPFFCLCCGLQICLRQFCYGRACGVCDSGTCEPGNRSFDALYRHTRYCRMQEGKLVVPGEVVTTQ